MSTTRLSHRKGDRTAQQQQQQQLQQQHHHQHQQQLKISATESDDIKLLSKAIVDYLDKSGQLFCDDNFSRNLNDENSPLPVKLQHEMEKQTGSAITPSTLLKETGSADCAIQTYEKFEESSCSLQDEPTHMTWDEVLREAYMLGIPLYRSPHKSSAKHQDQDLSGGGGRGGGGAGEGRRGEGGGGGGERRQSSASSSSDVSSSRHSTPNSSPIKKIDNRIRTESLHSKKKESNKPSRKIKLFSLHNFLARISGNSDKVKAKELEHIGEGTSHVPRRKHHTSLSSENKHQQLTANQRRSLSASATFKNRVNDEMSNVDSRSGTGSLSPRSSYYRPASSLSATYNISASGRSRGSSNSFLSTSLIASQSTSSLGSVFSRSSRGSNSAPPTTNSRNEQALNSESPNQFSFLQ